MFDRPTRQFLRWRDRGDADALAALFDRTAPELLRLASHLAAEPADAEDLVQGAFLAAIEAADRFERGRKVVPWLVGILTHLAHAERRRRQRAPVPGAVADAVVDHECEPAAKVVVEEQCETARAALERLGEPFRQPTLLRVVHGMEPAEIAVLLNRSPGTVRSQIHRGIEQARRALPSAVATGLLAATATAGRGLSMIRIEVLAAGARVAAAKAAIGAVTTSGVTIAGVVMSKQGAALTAVLLGCVAVLGVSLWSATGEDPGASNGDPGPGRANAMAANAGSESLRSTVTPVEPASRVAASPVGPADSAWSLAVRVLDGPSGGPIAGAPVDLFGARSMTLLELQQQLVDDATVGATGIPMPSHAAARIPRELPLEVTLGGARHPFVVPPAAGDSSIVHLVTDSNGQCVLPVPGTGAVLQVEVDGYGRRQIAFDEAVEGELEIHLWPSRRLVGFVRTATNEVPPIPLRLQLDGDGGRWSAKTDATGRFEATIAARRVQVSCRTPGWTITRNYTHADGGKRIALESLAADEQGTVYVTRFGGARLHVSDAETGSPIEVLSLRSFDGSDSPRHCGTFAAPGGWLSVAPFSPSHVLQVPAEHRDSFPSRISITVWADGYAPTTIAGLDLYGEDLPVVEVRLEPGKLESFRGRVVRGELAVEGARVQLRPFSALNWQLYRDCVLAAAETSGDGRFELAVPAGRYLCEVFADDQCHAQFAVALPEEGDRVIDLGTAVHVEVRVVDANGVPQVDHNVAVTAPNHQQRQGRTGADGSVVLGPFAGGRLRILAPRKPTQHSWTGTVSDEVDAIDGSRPVVTLRLPSDEWVRPVLVFEGTAPKDGFAGFRARSVGSSSDPVEVAVGADGAVAIDLRPGDGRLQVSAPNGRRWRLELPKSARQGHVFALRWAGLALAGIALTEDGKPLVSGRVFAVPDDSPGAKVSVATDAEGRFRLDGLESCAYFLGFHPQSASIHRNSGNNPYAMQLFRPDSLPAVQPVLMRIRLARFQGKRFKGRDEVNVSGRVFDSSNEPVEGAVINIMTLIPQEGGMLELFPVSGWQQAAADGSFTLTLARGDRYRASTSPGLGKARQTEVISLPVGSDVTRDIVLR